MKGYNFVFIPLAKLWLYTTITREILGYNKETRYKNILVYILIIGKLKKDNNSVVEQRWSGEKVLQIINKTNVKGH